METDVMFVHAFDKLLLTEHLVRASMAVSTCIRLCCPTIVDDIRRLRFEEW